MRISLLVLLVLLGSSGCSRESSDRKDERPAAHRNESKVNAIEEMARTQGKITDDQIETLVGYLGVVNLEGLTDLPISQAEKLCRHKYDGLCLDGLTTITEDLAKTLSGYQGDSLGLRGLSELTDKQAQCLANYEGLIDFGNESHMQTTFLAKVLSYQGPTELKAIHETVRKTGRLTDAEAQTLIERTPAFALYLSALVSLTDRQAEILAGYAGRLLYLDGLTKLTDSQAKHLAAYSGSLVFQTEELDSQVDKIKSKQR